MKTMKAMRNSVLVVCLLFLGTAAIHAQGDAAMRTHVRNEVMSMIEKDYETYATLSSDENIRAFTALFASDRVSVYNDLLGISNRPSMTVAEYVRLLGGKDIKSKRVVVKNISVSDESRRNDGLWQVTVKFAKELSYYNNCGVFFSSREFYGADYQLRATVTYDEGRQRCTIERITGMVETYNEMPEKYFVVKQSAPTDKNAVYDSKLAYNRTPIKFNSGRQAIIGDTYDATKFSCADENVKSVQTSIDDCNMVTLKYDLKPIHDMITAPTIRLKAHVDIPLGGALSVDGSLNKSNSSGFGFGIDFGYKLMQTGGLRLYGFAGLGLSMESLELGHSIADYSYKTDQDIDGSDYTRHYKTLSLNQKISLTHLTIPIYVNAEYAFGDMAAYANLGIRVNMNMSKKLEDDGSTVKSVFGVYDRALDEKNSIAWAESCNAVYNLGQNANGFGSDMKSLNNPVCNDIDGVAGTSMDLLAGVGVRYTIPRSPLTIDLGLNLVSGLGKIISPSDNDEDNKKYVYNKIGSDLKSTEYVNSLTNHLEGVKRQSMMLSVGLMYNF